MISVTSSGSYSRTIQFLTRIANGDIFSDLEYFGKLGVTALAKATPRDTGKTSNSWEYNVSIRKGRYRIEWINTNVVDGVPIAIILQYGHGTGTGGYVRGYDYINPAIRPIFDQIKNDVWRKVRS